MNKNEIADVLDEIAVLLELKGENTFKVRAYENAARSVRAIPADLDEFLQEHQLSEIKGIGKALAEKIDSLRTTGRLEYYDRLKTSIPPGLVEMTRIPNLGPKRITIINDRLEIDTVAKLEAACKSVVKTRLCRSGMRWSRSGGQHILSLRTYVKSNRWNAMWTEYKRIQRSRSSGNTT